MSVVSGHWGASLVSVAMALSILVGLNGTTMSGARVPFAAARDRLFPARMAHIHPRFQSPSTALVAQGLLSTLLLLLVGRFQQLFELAIFAEWLFYLLTATTIFVYRRRIPAAERPFKLWGYPVLPALFILAATVLLYYSFASNVRGSLVGTLIILAGLPVYFYFRAAKRKAV
jgi:basic amino acid/polyamine antiporter, APA family